MVIFVLLRPLHIRGDPTASYGGHFNRLKSLWDEDYCSHPELSFNPYFFVVANPLRLDNATFCVIKFSIVETWMHCEN